MKRFKLFVAIAAIFVALAAPIIVTRPALAADCAGNSACIACQGAGLADCNDPTTGPTVDNTIVNVVRVLSFVIGIIAVIMIIIGGLKYVTSNGDSSSITSAKNTILYALIGLAVVAVAQTLVHFTISRVTDTGTTSTPSSLDTKPVKKF